MKKRICLILTILIVFVFAACGKDESIVTSKETETSETSAVSIEKQDTSISEDVTSVSIEEPVVSVEVEDNKTEEVEDNRTDEEKYLDNHNLEILGYYGQYETPYVVEPIYEKEIPYDYERIFNQQRVTELSTKETLTEDEALEFFYLANFVNIHFKIMHEADTNETISTPEGDAYRWSQFNSIEEFRTYVLSLFTNEYADRKYSFDSYFDGPEGGLYLLEAGRGTNISAGSDFYEIEYVTDEKIVMHVATEIYAFDDENYYPLHLVCDFKLHDFVIEKIDGKWLFSEFHSLR